MDNGEVIPGLNEEWTFGGATVMEWASGMVAAMIYTELFVQKMSKGMPLFMLIFVAIPLIMATLRKRFPDEQRGVRNAMADAMGITPPGYPPSARLQPYWSGAPQRSLAESQDYVRLGLAAALAVVIDDEEAAEIRAN